MRDGLIDKEAHFIQHKGLVEKEKVLLVNEFDLARDLIAQNKHFRRLSYFVHTHYLVFWLCTKMYSESISSWWLPGLILFNSNWQKSQRPKPATGLIGPVGKTNWLNLLFSPLKLVGEKILKKMIKRPLLFQSNRKRVWK